jgi:hypothetical protein
VGIGKVIALLPAHTRNKALDIDSGLSHPYIYDVHRGKQQRFAIYRVDPFAHAGKL